MTQQQPHPGPWRIGKVFNPFSVQRHGPGNIEYVFRSNKQRDCLRHLLEKSHWRLELIGRYGVGKSTLLRTLEGWAKEEGRQTHRMRCSDEVPRLPLSFWLNLPARSGVVFLDGGERCPRWQLRLLAWLTRRRECGLVLTAHAPMGVARPLRMEASEDQLRAVVEQLLEGPLDQKRRVHLDNLLAAYNGSAREVIFRLYDEWERAEDVDCAR